MGVRILKFALCAATVLTLVASCDTDVRGRLYEWDGSPEYSFSAPSLHLELSDEDKTFSIPVYRTACAGSTDIDVEFEAVSANSEGMFELESHSVAFGDGMTEAEVMVSCKDISELELGQVYGFSLCLNGSKASPAGISAVEVTIKRELFYEVVGTAKYHSSFFKAK